MNKNFFRHSLVEEAQDRTDSKWGGGIRYIIYLSQIQWTRLFCCFSHLWHNAVECFQELPLRSSFLCPYSKYLWFDPHNRLLQPWTLHSRSLLSWHVSFFCTYFSVSVLDNNGDSDGEASSKQRTHQGSVVSHSPHTPPTHSHVCSCSMHPHLNKIKKRSYLPTVIKGGIVFWFWLVSLFMRFTIVVKENHVLPSWTLWIETNNGMSILHHLIMTHFHLS